MIRIIKANFFLIYSRKQISSENVRPTEIRHFRFGSLIAPLCYIVLIKKADPFKTGFYKQMKLS
jgi:hypothetical protein